MKNTIIASLFWAIVACTSCTTTIVSGPPCEEFQLGTVCFDNNTDDEIRIIIGDNKSDILPFSSVCFEMREDWYDYTGKRFLRRWRGEVFIERCEVVSVGLFD